MTEEQIAKQKKLTAVQNWIEKRKTGKIEQWPGRRNLMITAFLKDHGMTPGPKGTTFEKGTAKDFIRAQLDSLKRSGYYLRSTYTVPDSQGNPVEQFGTLISITKTGDLIYSCRTRHTVDPDSNVVEFVDTTDDDEVADAIQDEEKVSANVDDDENLIVD
jgi:hypothetical protein